MTYFCYYSLSQITIYTHSVGFSHLMYTDQQCKFASVDLYTFSHQLFNIIFLCTVTLQFLISFLKKKTIVDYRTDFYLMSVLCNN